MGSGDARWVGMGLWAGAGWVAVEFGELGGVGCRGRSGSGVRMGWGEWCVSTQLAGHSWGADSSRSATGASVSELSVVCLDFFERSCDREFNRQ